MKTTTRRTLAVGLLVFAAACSEQPVAPDVKQVTPGTQDVKPGKKSATEAQLNDVLHDIFGPNRSVANALLAQVKDQATSGDLPGAEQTSVELIELSIAKIGPGATTVQEQLVQDLAGLLGQYLVELGGDDIGLGVAFQGTEATIAVVSAEAGIVVPAQAVDQTTIFTITQIQGGCLIIDLPQSDTCWRYTAIGDTAFALPATLGECHDPGFVMSGQEDLVRLHAQDVVGGVTKVVSLPPVDTTELGFLSCVTLEAPEPQSGLFGLAQAAWQKLKGGLVSVLSPQPLHAGAAALALSRGYGGTKGSLTDVSAALPAKMSISAGNDQTAGIGTAVPIAPAVIVTDANDNPVAGATVHWKVKPGNGSVTPASVVTGVTGIASAAWTLGLDPGTDTLEASGHGLADSLGLDPGENHNGGPFADLTDTVQVGTGTLEFTAEAIVPAGGELVVINDVDVFNDVGTVNPGNQRLIKNLVSFSNDSLHGSGTTVWFDRGRSSKCGDFTGCLDGQLGLMISIIEDSVGLTKVDNNSGSSNRYGSIPATVKVIFLWNPTVSLQKKEVRALKNFMVAGGRVVLVGENKDFVGANGITFANRLLKDIGAGMRVRSDNIACPGPTLATVSPPPLSPIMTGVGGITIACASSMTENGEELFSSGSLWVAGVAVDLD